MSPLSQQNLLLNRQKGSRNQAFAQNVSKYSDTLQLKKLPGYINSSVSAVWWGCLMREDWNWPSSYHLSGIPVINPEVFSYTREHWNLPEAHRIPTRRNIAASLERTWHEGSWHEDEMYSCYMILQIMQWCNWFTGRLVMWFRDGYMSWRKCRIPVESFDQNIAISGGAWLIDRSVFGSMYLLVIVYSCQ